MESSTAIIVSRTGRPVQRIVLRLADTFTFRAGQYLEVVHPDGAIPLSIASAPHRLPELHLHYLSMPDTPEAARMDALLDASDELEIRGPAGTVALPRSLPAAALIAAGGTGVAQAMSFIDGYLERDPGAPLWLLWCADLESDFYLRQELEALEAPWLQTNLIADAARSSTNRGLRWLREHAGGFRHHDSRIVLAGSPGFVYAAQDALLEAGIAPRQMQSDVFSYAPRR
ncbi:MAG: hypothetical protein RIC56_18485 [Pseudomonadales bacterium]